LWGRIAATNAASDVFAMGARPLFALNIVGWHRDVLPLDLLGEVLAGADDVAREGGWVNVGGHSIDDREPKFGQAVIGEARPSRLLRNSALRNGDRLVLTDPIGTGAITTAIKSGTATDAAQAAAVEVMVRSNAEAARLAVDAGVRAATDVTGFGLLGHLAAMLDASEVAAELDVTAVPVLPTASAHVAAGTVPGGTRRNLDWVRPRLEGPGTEEELLVLSDAQTSGGLLLGVARPQVDGLVRSLRAAGHGRATVIGTVRGDGGGIRLR
jgi:selenide, water dikinase